MNAEITETKGARLLRFGVQIPCIIVLGTIVVVIIITTTKVTSVISTSAVSAALYIIFVIWDSVWLSGCFCATIYKF